MQLRFASVRRDRLYSPSHEQTDLLILRAVAIELERRGHQVVELDEAALPGSTDQHLLFHMCQGLQGIHWIQSMEDQGRLAINSARSVLNCYRVNLLRILGDGGFLIPTSVLVDVGAPLQIPGALAEETRLWLKRGDVHATQQEDVQCLGSAAALQRGLDGFRARGISQAIVQAHLEGVLIKFYGVRGTEFFAWYFAEAGQEAPLDENALRQTAVRAAEALGLDIYGGDMLLTADERLVLLDVNDWPSFARCRDAAAPCIAERIVQRSECRGEIL
jgi:hypothetical protein